LRRSRAWSSDWKKGSPPEEAQWLQAAEAGDALAVIATRAGVDVRTVRQHVDRARVEKELAAVRLSMVQVAADLHQQDLLGVAAALEAVLDPSLHSLQSSLEQTPGVMRSAGKRHRALLKHTKGSGLPHALSLWEAAAKRIAAGVGELRRQLEVAVAKTNLDPDGTSTAMLGRLAQFASYGAGPPDDLLWHVQGGDLRKGAFRILATLTSLDEPSVIDAQRAYEMLWTTISYGVAHRRPLRAECRGGHPQASPRPAGGSAPTPVSRAPRPARGALGRELSPGGR
jgi:hypothetical protein